MNALVPEETLFVYGLLRRGMSAGLDAFLGGGAAFLAEAYTYGTLYDVDGAYPGLVVSARTAGPEVRGELWSITKLGAWATLDDFEGIGPRYPEPQLYRRCSIEVVWRERQTVLAQAYVYNRDVRHLARVASGDWARR